MYKCFIFIDCTADGAATAAVPGHEHLRNLESLTKLADLGLAKNYLCLCIFFVACFRGSCIMSLADALMQRRQTQGKWQNNGNDGK
jgi:hypothetical protein